MAKRKDMYVLDLSTMVMTNPKVKDDGIGVFEGSTSTLINNETIMIG